VVDARPRRDHGDVADPLQQAVEAFDVVGVSAIPSTSPCATTASRWASMAGPGSITQRSTSHVFVPVSVSGLGLSARIRTTP
jgi:hypothetical protein